VGNGGFLRFPSHQVPHHPVQSRHPGYLRLSAGLHRGRAPQPRP
jgi:hypothetical protein